MKHELFNDNWKFWEDKDAFALIWSVPDNAQTVRLPHDAMIGARAYAASPTEMGPAMSTTRNCTPPSGGGTKR